MKTILQISSVILLIVAIWFIHDVMSASFLYPQSNLKMAKTKLKEYGENNKVNGKEIKEIESLIDQSLDSNRTKFGSYGAIKIIGALCLFSSSLLMFLASKKIEKSIEPKDAGDGVPPPQI